MSLSGTELLQGSLSTLALLILIAIAYLVRGTAKWTQTQDKQDQLIDRVTTLVADKDKVHNEILAQMRYDRDASEKILNEVRTQMRYDRDATDKRLRDLEKIWIERGAKT